jgi:hypothetical protein
MKPFNLKEALAGKPVVTREGKKVLKIVDFSEYKNDKHPLVTVIENVPGKPTFTHTGNYLVADIADHRDLFMASTRKTGYINVYEGDIYPYKTMSMSAFRTAASPSGKVIYSTKEEADHGQLSNRIGIAVLSYEE